MLAQAASQGVCVGADPWRLPLREKFQRRAFASLGDLAARERDVELKQHHPARVFLRPAPPDLLKVRHVIAGETKRQSYFPHIAGVISG